MKSTRSRSRRVPTTRAEPSAAAQQDNISEEQESQRTEPANEEVIARITEFVAENPNIFYELRRYFKRQDTQKTESSKRRSVKSPLRRNLMTDILSVATLNVPHLRPSPRLLLTRKSFPESCWESSPRMPRGYLKVWP